MFFLLLKPVPSVVKLDIMKNLFSNKVPRRAFIKNTLFTIGGFGVFTSAEYAFQLMHRCEAGLLLRDGKASFLDDIFFPLANSSSLNASNFHFYSRVMEIIDDSICFRSGIRSDFDGTTITTPTPCTYRDIPELLHLFNRKCNTAHFSRLVNCTGSEYALRAKALRSCTGPSRLSSLALSVAEKCDQVASLYGVLHIDVVDQAKLYREILLGTEHAVTLVEARLAAKRGELPLFELTAADEAALLKLYKKSSVECCKELKRHIETALVGCQKGYAIPLRQYLHAVIRTDLLRNLIKGSDYKTIFKLIVARIKRIFRPLKHKNSAAFEKRVFNYIPVRIDHLLKISLKLDFEQGVYRVMMKGLPEKLTQDLEDCVVMAMRSFRESKGQQLLEIMSLDCYVAANVDSTELVAYNQLLRMRLIPFPNDKLIALLPEQHRQAIVNFQTSLRLTLGSNAFKEIVAGIKGRDFSCLREKLRYMEEDEAANILYLLMSNIGYDVYNKFVNPTIKPEFVGVLISDSESSPAASYLRLRVNSVNALLVPDSSLSISPTAMDSRYSAENSEIRRLKKKGDKINCVTISALMNEVMERLLGLPSLGVPIYRSEGNNTSHLVNGIRFGTKLLVVDVTNNEYYFSDLEACDGKFACDTMKFANAYMNGAIDNVSCEEWYKSFSTIEMRFIKAYLLESFPDKYAMARANLYKNRSWRNIQKYC